MKITKKKTVLCVGLATCVLSMSVVVVRFIRPQSASFTKSIPNEYSLTLNSSNKPTNIPVNLSNQFGAVISATVTTVDGNAIPLAFTLAKANASGFVTLGNHGTIYNYGEALGRFKGITSIKVIFDGALTFDAGNYELQNGGAYLDVSQELTSGTAYTLPNPARYFRLTAGDAYSNITSIELKYSCSGEASEMPNNPSYVVEDFNRFTATGNGYDTNGSGHPYYSTTNMRSSLYGDYRNTGTSTAVTNAQALEGTNWTTMGGSDYITYADSLDGQSKVALLKATNSNNMRYIQMKEVYGEPSIVGKGNTLSIKMHSGYTSTAATTATTQNVVVKMFAFYNSKFDKTASSNTADITEYTVFAGSGWQEYKMQIDPSKEYYAFGLCYVMKALTGTVYMPIDDVTIYTENRTQTAPSGNYFVRTPVLSYTFPVIISFADRIDKVAVVINNKDAGVTGHTIDESGNFSITTSGGYTLGSTTYTYGTITGKWDSNTNTLINVALDGTIKSAVTDNGHITMSIPQLTLDCDGDNATLRTIFRRQYWDGSAWSIDTGNADRFSADITNVATGTSGLRPRMHSSYRTGVMLNNALHTKDVQSICMWIYNPGSKTNFINFTVYKTTNYTSTDAADRYVFDYTTEIDTGWTFYCMGFNHNTNFRFGTDTLENICLNVKENRVVTFDSISLYN